MNGPSRKGLLVRLNVLQPHGLQPLQRLDLAGIAWRQANEAAEGSHV